MLRCGVVTGGSGTEMRGMEREGGEGGRRGRGEGEGRQGEGGRRGRKEGKINERRGR